jgi:hypothetical protein
VRKWMGAGRLTVVRLSPRQVRVTRGSAVQLERSLSTRPPQPLE